MTKAQPSESRARRKRGLRAVAVCAALLTNLLITVLPAQAAPSRVPAAHPARMRLPVPTGRFHVGEVTLHLADTSRRDPWHPGKDDRELMVSVYYPTTRTADRPAAPYMLPRAAAHFDSVTANDYLGMDLPTGRADWAATVTHAAQGAPVAHGDRKRPVLLYSPGLGEPRTWGTTSAADLASRGYVVVTIDNTYESPEVQFPDGSLATMVTPDDPDAFIRKALTVRDADTSFVLDQLGWVNSGRNPDVDGRSLPHGLAGALDLSRVGMFGHSLGGTATATAMDADPRIRAGINMDGNLTHYDGTLMPVAERGLARPLLLMGKDGATDTGPGWAAFRAHTPGWTRQLRLRGAEHASFTDAEALLPQLDLPPGTLTRDIGTIAPATAVRTNEAYVSAFFDHWLRGTHDHLLDGPSPRYPAMEFVE
ncbi:Tat pathway signal protein [Streptomyces cellostaticus]|uniref:Tat pathway signal protein n=1 Tax=Streptomyces cellostaticus TaxID=67285 RepID=A0A101NQD9_9ACTN|nr:Tat pathway signal protein [Streptomyces cellostaticus]KUM97479.1 Tat pathway signal protein [Streptomyces cellostaticus]GHI04039.1 lipase [Streptomyces cellostaticus]